MNALRVMDVLVMFVAQVLTHALVAAIWVEQILLGRICAIQLRHIVFDQDV